PVPLVVGAVCLDRVDDVQPVLLAQAEVFLTECDRGVDQARAVLGRDEIRREYGMAAWAIRRRWDERERRFVTGALERTTGEAVQDFGPGAEHALEQSLGEHEHLLATGAR